MQTQNLVEFEFFLQKFCVDLFSQSEESQNFVETNFRGLVKIPRSP